MKSSPPKRLRQDTSASRFLEAPEAQHRMSPVNGRGGVECLEPRWRSVRNQNGEGNEQTPQEWRMSPFQVQTKKMVPDTFIFLPDQRLEASSSGLLAHPLFLELRGRHRKAFHILLCH